jgi:ribosome maturation factor RimP
MHEPAGNVLFIEVFERVAHALPHQAEFRGVEIVTAVARPGRHETQLVVTVDREGGVDVSTCERIAAKINVSLDAFADPYTLEVSSAGVNRPLVAPADYERFSGKNVRVITTLPIANAKTHRGALDLPIPLAAIKAANIEYDIRADLARAKREKQDS